MAKSHYNVIYVVILNRQAEIKPSTDMKSMT